MKYLPVAAALLSANVAAIEYVAPGNPEILQMHDESTWQQVCQTTIGRCDVPAGVYQVKLMDANWRVLDVIRGVRIGGTNENSPPGIHYETHSETIPYYGGWERGPRPASYACKKGVTIGGACRVRWGHTEDSDVWISSIMSINALGIHCDAGREGDATFGSDIPPSVHVEIDAVCMD